MGNVVMSKADAIIVTEKIKFSPPKKLSSGSQGAVFKSFFWKSSTTDKTITSEEIPAALKTYHDKSSVEEIEREISILKDLKHPNIVKFYGVTMLPLVSIDPQLTMVLEYMPRSLADYLDDSAKQSTTLKYLIDTATALEYLHNLGLVHFDIKPGNILLDSQTAKLCDFGTAAKVGSEIEDFKGTLLFTDPRQIIHSYQQTKAKMTKDTIPSMKASPDMDIYSFAILLCCCFKGNQPYPESIHMKNDLVLIYQLAYQQKNIEKPDIDSDERVPKPFAALIKQCWNENPAARPNITTVKEQLIELTASENQIRRINSC